MPATIVRQPLTTSPNIHSGSSILTRKIICRTGISRSTSCSDISRNLQDKTLNRGLSSATRSTETFELAWRGLMIRALVSYSNARSLMTMLTSPRCTRSLDCRISICSSSDRSSTSRNRRSGPQGQAATRERAPEPDGLDPKFSYRQHILTHFRS
jgi:hypothetical protein